MGVSPDLTVSQLMAMVIEGLGANGEMIYFLSFPHPNPE